MVPCKYFSFLTFSAIAYAKMEIGGHYGFPQQMGIGVFNGFPPEYVADVTVSAVPRFFIREPIVPIPGNETRLVVYQGFLQS